MKNSELKKGVFLIASPQISSGIFYRSVILLCEHSFYGSFGIIINKLPDYSLSNETCSSISILKDFGHVSLKIGGPVQTDKVIIMHNNPIYDVGNSMVRENTYIGANLKIEKDRKDKNSYFHLFIGYSGWTGGMLEKEVNENNWFIYSGKSINIFSINIDNLWKNILVEMGGKYASMSTIPEDILLN